MRSAHSRWTTLGLPQPKVACASWVYTAQAPGCSARALSQVGPTFHALPKSAQVLGCSRSSHTWIGIAFCALPRSKQLRRPGTWLVHCPRWAMHLMHLPGYSCLISQVCCKSTAPGVPGVSSQELISGCDTPGRCEPSRVPGMHG